MVTVVVTESRLRYQDLRGLTRSFSVAFPSRRLSACSVVSKDFAFLGGDRWFESASLQR
jgi:hypothetical protein